MRLFLVALLILTISASAGPQVLACAASTPMTPDQLATTAAGGFAGGAICGLSAVAFAVGAGAIIGAATGGVALPFSVYLGTVVAGEIIAVCAIV